MKKFIKHLCLVTVFLAICLVAVSCVNIQDKPKEDNYPVFHGVEDKTIEKGSTFLPLEGVTVTDEEDGNINLSSVTVDSKGFNANVEGEYKIKYTVYDADGHKTEVTRTIKVVYTDVTKPELYGVADKEIVLGDETFGILKDVSAIDNKDGDLTAAIKVTGEVDIWNLGEYTVNYEVADAAGNKNTVDRKVKVTLGSFGFKDENKVQLTSFENPTVSGGEIFPALGQYSLLKLEVAMSAATETEVAITIAGAKTGPAIKVKDAKVYEIYYTFTAPLDKAAIAINGAAQITGASYNFAICADLTAPVLTGAPTRAVAVPLGATAAQIKAELIRGVTAEDDIDGNVTSKIDADLAAADLTKTGTYKVKIFVEDSNKNRAEAEVDLMIANARDTGVIKNPTFEGDSTEDLVCTHNSGGSVVEEVKDGMYVLNITTAGGWASGDSPYVAGLKTTILNAEHYYMFKFDAKADVARKMIIRAGAELWGDPWIEDYRDRPTYNLTTDWQTFYFIFYVDKSVSTDGSDGIKFELQCGAIDWSAAENNNVIYFDNMQFYLLSNESNAPVISKVDGKKTKFGVGATLPDFTDYITATDIEDGNITITAAMVDATAINVNVAGDYKVKFTVTDSDGETAEDEITITILAEADTTGPVVTLPAAARALIEASMPVKEGTNLTETFAKVLAAITIVDDVDANITPTMDMVDLDGLKVTAAEVGEYEVKISCKDSSGNDSNVVSITITVTDGTPPTFVGVRNYTVYVGQVFDPTKGVCAYDTTDKAIALTVADLSGFEAFMDGTGKVIGAPGQYQVGYKAKDAAGNEANASATITVEAEEPEYNTYGAIDLLGQKIATNSSKSKLAYDAEGVATLTYAGPEGWYASAIQQKYYHVALQKGTTYKLVIEGYAELPREFVIYFVDAAGVKHPGFEGDGASLTKLKVGLTAADYVFEYIFTPTSDSSNDSTFEIDWDWESYLINSGAANTITLKQIKFIPQGENVEPPAQDEPIVKIDFEDGNTGNKYTNPAWTEYKYTSQWDKVTCDMNARTKVTKVANIVGGNGYSYKYIYNEGGACLGTVNKIKFQLGNYFDPKKSVNIKVSLLDANGQPSYILGDGSTWYALDYQDAMYDFEKTFTTPMEVYSFQITINSSYSGNQYVYMDNILMYGEAPAAPADTTAPVITISEAVTGALATLNLTEGQNITTIFQQLLAGISAHDDVDGDITVDATMVNLNGLNVASCKSGVYPIVITVADAAGNKATETLKIKVGMGEAARAANLTLDFEDGAGSGKYTNPKWTSYKYTSSWEKVATPDMNSRSKVTKVANIVGGNSMSIKYMYNETGESLGLANNLKVQIGNYFDPKKDIKLKISLIGVDGSVTYLLGNASDWGTIPAGDTLVDYNYDFEEMNVQTIQFTINTAQNQYCYLDNIILTKAE